MYYLACDGTWTSTEGGTPQCSGTLRSVSATEMGATPLSDADRKELYDSTIVLFAIVFGIVVARRALK
ncbi:hypothetical protein [Labrys sp. ZIDIC5]|uniref:hypothetical protein n=1 Tax=Labrys sedimenti TaxID=3106036 RepID=UPI002ACA8D33|nr:hypothetical protein [Labrys sp. ZIDIC5]MDZ5454894.1 hypothetical protein [Labrys sp. ZIDIC5]